MSLGSPFINSNSANSHNSWNLWLYKDLDSASAQMHKAFWDTVFQKSLKSAIHEISIYTWKRKHDAYWFCFAPIWCTDTIPILDNIEHLMLIQCIVCSVQNVQHELEAEGLATSVCPAHRLNWRMQWNRVLKWVLHENDWLKILGQFFSWKKLLRFLTNYNTCRRWPPSPATTW